MYHIATISVIVILCGVYVSESGATCGCVRAVDFDVFEVGMAIETEFITPSSGRAALNLLDASDNIYLHVNPRWDTYALVLNTLLNGAWGPEERPGGFDFSSGVPTIIRVEAHEDHFKVLQNGKLLHEYAYRDFDITGIVKATAYVVDDGALISLGVRY